MLFRCADLSGRGGAVQKCRACPFQRFPAEIPQRYGPHSPVSVSASLVVPAFKFRSRFSVVLRVPQLFGDVSISLCVQVAG